MSLKYGIGGAASTLAVVGTCEILLLIEADMALITKRYALHWNC
jgi:hypothetical protein